MKDWVYIGAHVERPDGLIDKIIRITEDKGVLLEMGTRYYCRTELKPFIEKPTKIELIDKAIDDLGGVFQPKGDYFCYGIYGLNNIKFSLFYRSDSNYICSREEFEQRKKEREMEKANNNWYDYAKNCNVSLPPVDTVCEYTLSDGRTWYKCKVISHNNLVLDCPHLESMDNNGLQVLRTEADTVKFRPLDWDKLSERKQAINYAMELSPDWAKLDDIFGFLYDAGMLKLPEEK